MVSNYFNQLSIKTDIVVAFPLPSSCIISPAAQYESSSHHTPLLPIPITPLYGDSRSCCMYLSLNGISNRLHLFLLIKQNVLQSLNFCTKLLVIAAAIFIPFFSASITRSQ
eukprot:Tbor_TRINITY_DN5529_c0_g1::TRINITY_DN5529_c0_g1_i1::g.12918::m.12918